MAPKAKDAAKGKKKKKTKEELEEERRQAEEAARLAEEERLRAEEAERQRLAELERQRLELLGQFLDAEKARLDAQLSELDPLLRQFEHERSRARAAAREAAEWERFLRCMDVPHPRQRVPLAEFLRRMGEAATKDVTGSPDGRDLGAAFLAVEACRTVILEARQELLAARLSSELAVLPAAVAAGGGGGAASAEEAQAVAGSAARDAAGGAAAAEWTEALESDLRTLYGIVNARIDRLTAAVLHHCDEYANDKNEIQLGHVAPMPAWGPAAAAGSEPGAESGQGPAAGQEPQDGLEAADGAGGAFKWGVWVNTAKNPRLKAVEMPQLGVSLEIPKQIALANVALRVQQRSGPGVDEFFSRCANAWMAVGGLLTVDLLAMPPGAKKVRGWTLRQVTPLALNVQRVPYPIPPAGADPATWTSEEEPPPLGVTAPLPPDVVLLQEPLQVAWWDEAHSIWNTDGISNVAYDDAANTFSFHTTHLAPLALVMRRTRLLPYAGWSIRPTGGRNGNSAAISLDVGLDAPVVIEVSKGTAALSSSNWPQLASLIGQPMPPLDLLQALSDRGLHLLPEDRDAEAAGVTAKERPTEEAMCRDLALLGGVFLMASSRWNQTAGPAEALARLSEVTDWEEGGRTAPHHLARIFEKEKEDGERRVLVVMRRGAKGVAFSDALNRRPEYPALPGVGSVEAVKECELSIWGEVHASVLTLLRGQFAAPGAADNPLALRLAALPESLELCRTTSPLFTATLADTMLALRLFSFS
ncbi:hypothetical protein HYH02_007036 [Chlamydomonas schloesseri]|uniref:IC97/Casc1 N-terminal domain-containing protein n=1 Tax=Chlamydomonas schloesseri TaxID=2026947 RepID=A0A835WIM7_9CHLO|nr:hypothetical protein HYH02_007036 [Chlamydomonas schloesseri]|eukprot:KAG2448008.1 hypothetical protein HYH02_007036 [Chlamydomonas schloesseri]